MAATFVPSQFVRLQSLLQRAVSSPSSSGAGTGGSEWYIAVDGLRNELLDLGRVKAMDEGERKEIEGGKITIGGTSHTLNPDFSALTLVLASSLNVSPLYCASLLQAALSSRSRWPGHSPVEIALNLYHRERWAITESWKQITQAAVTFPLEDDPDRRRLGLKFSQALQNLLAHMSPDAGSKRDASIVKRLLLEIDSLKQQANATENSIRNPPSNATHRLPDDVHLGRLSAIRQERRAWAHVVYLLCISGMLRGDELLAVANWLNKVKEDERTGEKEELLPYLLSALLSGLENSAKISLEGLTGPGMPDILDDRNALTQLNATINTAVWSTPSLQAVVQLQWCLLLVHVVKHDPSLGGDLQVTDETVSQAVLKAIQKGDALVYIVVRLLSWRQQQIDALEGSEEEEALATPASAQHHFGSEADQEVDVEFQHYLLSSLHALLLGTSRAFLTLLRRIQRQEEDAAYSTSRAGNSQSARRYDLEALLDGIALVVRGDVSKSMQFWLSPEGRRSRFLSWAIDLTEEGHQRALLDLLTAMASGGGEGAWQAHALLSSPQQDGSDGTLVSWTRLWDWIGYYIEGLHAAAANKEQRHISMPPSEAALLRSFLRLLSSVVSGSFAAREALLAITLSSAYTAPPSNPNPFGLVPATQQSGTGSTVLQRLFLLYICHVPMELKATLLDALAAFAKDGPVGSGTSARASQVRREIWSLLESSGILTTDKVSTIPGGFGLSSLGSLRASQYHRPQAAQQSGVRFELEQVEAPSGVYPATTSFVKLLTALIANDARNAGRASGNVHALVADLPSTPLPGQAVQASLPLGGSASPHPSAAKRQSDFGLEKYLSFVIDAVLLPSLSNNGSREFATFGEKWRLVSAALQLLERCLATFDLVSLEKTVPGREDRGADDPDTLLRLAMHPGFGVMKRLMGSGKLLREVLTILSPQAGGSAGFEVVDSPAARKAIFLPAAVKFAMGIVLKALRGQDLFLQVMLPCLANLVDPDVLRGFMANATISLPAGFNMQAGVGQSASYTAIDTKLLQEHESVVQMTLYVNSSRDDLAFLGVQLLGEIAQSNAFSEVDRFADGVGGAGRRKMNRLVGLFEMTDESDRLREGIVRRLDALAESDDAEELTQNLEDHENEELGDNVLEGTVAASSGGNEAICRTILDLLLANTTTSTPAPNIAHLLLGFDLRVVSAEEQVVPLPGPSTPRGAFHSLLDLLRGGSGTEGDEESGTLGQGLPPLLENHPALAEKALALLVRLITHPFTTSCTLRYLRTQEDFWVQQLRRNFDTLTAPVPRGAPIEPLDGSVPYSRLARGSYIYPDGKSFTTSADALIASIKSRQHILNGIAIELHSLVNAGMHTQAARLAGAMYGSGVIVASATRFEADVDVSFSGGTGTDGSGTRLLELLQSFDFDWHDERDDLGNQIALLANLDLAQARSVGDAAVSREYDIGKVIALLAAARRVLERQGDLAEPRKRASFDQESAMVLQYASARNARRVIDVTRRAALTSWRNVHDLVLSHSNIFFRPEARATVVFDCLAALLPRLEGPAPDEDPVLADLAAGAILALLTSLRRHRAALGAAAQLSGTSELLDDLPSDRLILTLRALIGALLRAGTSVSARGNLYSALINYLQLTKTAPPHQDSQAQSFHDDSLSAITGTDADDVTVISLGSTFGGGSEGRQPSVLDTRTRTLLASHAERLIPVIARDALDAPDVWRTVALTLLDKLCVLETSARAKGGARGPVVLDILSRGGFLKSFVARLRNMDVDLQEVLRPDPSSLNALYVYEAKMAFFARLSQTPDGAERLLEAKLYEVFAQADYLAAKPEQDQDFVDLESFLPAATERYGALLLPALQVSVNIINVASAHKARASIIGVGATGSSGIRHPNAALQQALTLLNAHTEAFLGALKAAVQETVSLASIEQAHLIVVLLLQVLPILDEDALTSPKPLAAYHSAVLALAAGFLHSTAWKARIVPFTESEREDEAVAAPDLAPLTALRGENGGGLSANDDSDFGTVFDSKASQAVSRLVTSVLSYLEAASESHSSGAHSPAGVRPCLTSSLVVPQPFRARAASRTPMDGQDEPFAASTLRRTTTIPGSGRLTSVPSLGVALASLDEHVAGLEKDLHTADAISALLDDSSSLRFDEWERLARQSLNVSTGAGFLDPSSSTGPQLGNAGIGQRRAVAMRELSIHLRQLEAHSSSLLDAIDLLLIIVCRHFGFYLSVASALSSPASANAGYPTGVDDFSAPWRSQAAGVAPGSSRSALSLLDPAAGANVDANALLSDGGQMVQMVLERLGGVLLTLGAAASGSEGSDGSQRPRAESAFRVSNARERCAFLELVGRKLQTLLLVRSAERDGGEN